MPYYSARDSSLPSSQDVSRQGFIYVLDNPSMPGVLKIGATRKHPLQRMKELGAGTGVPTPFGLVYFHDYSDCFLAETLIHQAFASQRVNEAREFFRVTPQEVITLLTGLTSTADYREQLESVGIEGGMWIERGAAAYVPTPFAELFATFPDDGSGRELTSEEQEKCRALWRRS